MAPGLSLIKPISINPGCRLKNIRKKFTSLVIKLPSAPKDAPKVNKPPTLINLLLTSAVTNLPCANLAAIGPYSWRDDLSYKTTSGILILSKFSSSPSSFNTLDWGLKPMTSKLRGMPVMGFFQLV